MKRVLLWVLSVVSLMHTSCVSDVILDVGEKPQVVVECVLTDDDAQELYLHLTKSASKVEIEPVADAVVQLYDLTESRLVGQFTKQEEDDKWVLDYSAVPTHRYRLEVNVPGYVTIYAEDTMPDMDIRAVWYSHFFSDYYSYEYHSYNYVVFLLESLPNHTYISGMNYNPDKEGYEVAEQICTDYPYVDNFNLTGGIYAPQIDTVYRNGYVYYESLYPDLIGSSLHRRYLRIPQNSELKKKWLIVSGDFQGEYNYELTTQMSLVNDGKLPGSGCRKGYVSFMGVSESYDKYLQEALYFQQLQESSDMTSIYIRDNIYTNIIGGLGIFGAMKEEKMQWSNVKSADFSRHYD